MSAIFKKKEKQTTLNYLFGNGQWFWYLLTNFIGVIAIVTHQFSPFDPQWTLFALIGFVVLCQAAFIVGMLYTRSK